MVLHGDLATAERVLVDFRLLMVRYAVNPSGYTMCHLETHLDLLRSVSHEDSRVRLRRRHLSTRPLESSQELGVDQSRLRRREPHAVGVFAQKSEVRVLINAHGDQTGDVGDRLGSVLLGLFGPQLGVRSRERSDTLHRGEEQPADVGAFVEPECATDLVKGDQLSELPSVHQEVRADVFQVAVDERLLHVKAQGNDILGVVHRILHCLFEGEAVLEQGLLVVRKHEDQRNVEDILQPLRERQRDGVPQMQAAGTRATAGVEEEGLSLLLLREDLVKVTVAEEEAASEPTVRLVAGDFLEAIKEILADQLGVPFPVDRDRSVSDRTIRIEIAEGILLTGQETHSQSGRRCRSRRGHRPRTRG